MRKNRIAQELNTALSKRVAVYALTGAAGLALSTPRGLDAAIVYTSAKQFGESAHDSVIPIDLNHDGTVDFSLNGVLLYDSFSGFGIHTAYVAVPAFNGAVAASGTRFLQPIAAALHFGQEVGPSLVFAQPPYWRLLLGVIVALPSGYGTHGGNFYNKSNKFLGLKFEWNGSTYYGWARVNLREVVGKQVPGKNFVFELADYAYQDRPNVPILAGDGIPQADAALPASLGLLAYGSDAIPAWRSGSH